jgi:hypothetical protein
MEYSESIEEKIQYILDNFDFEKCHQMMKLVGWGWAGVGIPSVNRLKESALDRIKGAIEQVYERPPNEDIHIPNNMGSEVSYYSSSGGLKATVWCKKQEILCINLEFVFTDWSAGCE